MEQSHPSFSWPDVKMLSTQVAGCSYSDFGQLDEPIPCNVVENRNIKNGKRIGVYYPRQKRIIPMKRVRERRRSQPHGKYKSELRVRRKKIWLGNFITIEEALIAYDIALHYIGRHTIHNRYHPNYFKPFQHAHKTYTDPKEIEKFLKEASKDSFEWECFKTYVRDEQTRILGMQSIQSFVNKRMNVDVNIASEGDIQCPQTGFVSEVASPAPAITATAQPFEYPSASSPSSLMHDDDISAMLSGLHVHSEASNSAAEISHGTRHYIPEGVLSFEEDLATMPTDRVATGIFSTDPSSILEIENIEGLLCSDATDSSEATDSDLRNLMKELESYC